MCSTTRGILHCWMGSHLQQADNSKDWLEIAKGSKKYPLTTQRLMPVCTKKLISGRDKKLSLVTKKTGNVLRFWLVCCVHLLRSRRTRPTAGVSGAAALMGLPALQHVDDGLLFCENRHDQPSREQQSFGFRVGNGPKKGTKRVGGP